MHTLDSAVALQSVNGNLGFINQAANKKVRLSLWLYVLELKLLVKVSSIFYMFY